MAGDWLKVEVSTPSKPEVWLIAEECSLDPDAVVGKLIRIWAWFDQQTEKGNAPTVTKKLLDRDVGVTGFCDSMISAGWLEESEGKISIPDLDKHNSQTAKTRAVTAKRVAKHKAKTGNGSSVSGALPREDKDTDIDKKKKRVGRGCRLAIESIPPDWEKFCRDERPTLDPLAVFDRFSDYWIAQPGQKGVKLDWMATWRNWVRNERGPKPTGPTDDKPKSPGNRIADQARALQASRNTSRIPGTGDAADLGADERDVRPPLDHELRRIAGS